MKLIIIILCALVCISHIPQTSSFTTTSRKFSFHQRSKALGASKEPKKVELPIKSAKQYLNKEDRPYLIGSKPDSGLNLALSTFKKEIGGIFSEIKSLTLDKVSKPSPSFPEILNLKLSNQAVKQAETDREKFGGRVDAHPISRTLYDIGCLFLDKFFDERPLPRFWFLETVARIPYFAYVSMLHLYETLGWWREPSLRKIHDAEEWNELHHLLIMETLGADKVLQSNEITSGHNNS